MIKFGPQRVVIIIFVLTIFFLFAFLQTLNVDKKYKLRYIPQQIMEPLPPAPKLNYVEKRLAQKPNLKSIAPLSKPSLRMIELYKIQAAQRRAFLNAVHTSLSKNYMYLYNNLAPEVNFLRNSILFPGNINKTKKINKCRWI
ncbi:unnamed protein product [Strongylus vulgaris]|uniref:Uncharacterized protein n=1 Tax=Strongylus vulgaris TaxID=40348 RepID=A0A3P7J502_STRVU|nr:unnamed protein product [Strongylus vulgaris]